MTRLEQLEDYAQLEAIWNGALEASGIAPGLSSYQGASTLYVPEDDRDERPKMRPSRLRDTGVERGTGKRGHDRRPRVMTDALMRSEMLLALKRGESYKAICRRFGCSMTIPRRLARRHGIDRRELVARTVAA